MKPTMFGRALAAMLLLGCATTAQASGYGGSSSGGYSTPTNIAGAITPPSGRTFPFMWDLSQSGSAFVSGEMRCSPGVVPRTLTVTKLLGKVLSNGATGLNAQFALYASKADGSGPSTLLGSTTSMVTDTTGANILGPLSTAVTLNPNTLYWRCSMLDNTTVTLTSTGTAVQALAGSAGAGVNTNVTYYGVSIPSQTFNNWPADLTSATSTELSFKAVPQMWLQVQ